MTPAIRRRVVHLWFVARSFVGAVYAVIAGYACEWRCDRVSRAVRTDIGGASFAVCIAHDVEGVSRLYWRRHLWSRQPVINPALKDGAL